MRYSKDQLRKIYDSTSGHCVYPDCHKKLSFSNYGNYDEKGAWEVAHSIFPKRVWDIDKIHIPGTDPDLDISNRAPACRECNRGDQRGKIGSERLFRWVTGED